jgi:feruloyl esterase
MLQMGGGGYNGTVVTGLDYVSMAWTLPPMGSPLAQGYATYGSDSGHVGSSIDASFGTNDAMMANFGHEHLKKTKDTVAEIIKLAYNKAATKSYFAGASTGGREGMTAAQRYPQDYDGIIAIAPAINFAGVRLQGVKVGQSAYAPGGYINNAKQKLILKVSVDACDTDDGLADRIVSNVEACRTKVAAIKASLRCVDGIDTGDTCLSDAQLKTVSAVSDDLVLTYALANNVNRHEGYNILQGADFSGTTLGLGTTATIGASGVQFGNGYLFFQGDGYLKSFITKNSTLNTFTFDFANPGTFQQTLNTVSGIVGAMNPDLEAFRARGGKLIVMHGLADQVISPNPMIAYYKAQVTKSGQSTVDSFLRFYTAPGFGHGDGAFVPAWDALGALNKWSTKGEVPGILVATDSGANFGRSRPLCPYPGFPKFNGTGPSYLDSSFTCANN